MPSTGGLAFRFTPDSSKLVMSTAMSSFILVIDLGVDGAKPRVLRRFDHHRIPNTFVRDRLTVTRRAYEDVGMKDPDASEGAEEDVEGEADLSPVIVNITRIAISLDGQWLATSDDHSRTHLFNLDSVQVS